MTKRTCCPSPEPGALESGSPLRLQATRIGWPRIVTPTAALVISVDFQINCFTQPEANQRPSPYSDHLGPLGASVTFLPSATFLVQKVLRYLVPQLGLPPLQHLEKSCPTCSDCTVATLTSAIFITMEDTHGKINTGRCRLHNGNFSTAPHSIEVAGLFLK